jgi:molybdopterin-guanine dinucleotide biosynthesis protein B
MPPIISVVGHSNSGKTTVIEKMIAELKARGYQVATIKNAPVEATLDAPGKDSWRHIEAGSDATVVSAKDRLLLIKPVSSPANLDTIAPLFGEDYDIVLAEGFKQDNAPKIEVHRKETGPLLTDLKKLIAVVTNEPVETKARQFSFSDMKGLVDLIEEGFIKPENERLSLYVNGIPIVLTSFPREFIAKVLLAMASSLKGVGEVKSLAVFFAKRP